MDVGQWRPLEIGAQLFEVAVALSGESDDDIRANGGIRHPRVDSVHEGGILSDGVRPSHGREHPIAGVLQRKMKVRRETGGGRDQIDDLGRAVHGLERADPKQHSDVR